MSSGEKAVTKAKEHKPDLVLMDIILKGEMNGIEAAEQISAQFHIPVIYLSAFADEEFLERAKITKPFGYITKPFEDEALHTAIEIALYKHKAEEALRRSEETLKSIFMAAPIGIGMVSDRVIKQANDRFCEMTGYSKDELIGQSARIVYPTDEEFEHVGQEKYALIRDFGTWTD